MAELTDLQAMFAELESIMTSIQGTIPDPNTGVFMVSSPAQVAAREAKIAEAKALMERLTALKPQKPRLPRKPVLHTDGGSLGPVAHTPRYVVQKMLEVAELTPDDILYDLGSCDGRIVLEAADLYRIQAGGVEINPWWINFAQAWAVQRGLKSYVDFRQADALTVDLARATVVTLALSAEGNLALRPQLRAQLRPGARIVSFAQDMGDWVPDLRVQAEDHFHTLHWVYLWRIGDKARKDETGKEIWE